MRKFVNTGIRKILFLLIISHLVVASCSKKFTPSASATKTEVQPEKASTGDLRNYPDNHNPIQKENPVYRDISDKSRNEQLIIPGEKKSATVKAEDIIETARGYFGVPHCMGGLTRKCIDCSGLLVKVFEVYGIMLPHSAQEQSKYGETISRRNDLAKGDLVFFTRSYKTKKYITHSGIYAGDNKFIHSSSHKGVSIGSLDDPYWKAKFVFGKRILD